jgi:putative ATP-binding cassette transporter
MTPNSVADGPAPPAVRQAFLPLVRAFRAFLVTLWSTEGRRVLTLLTVGIVLVIGATVAAQVALNAWNRPFYNAVQTRDLSAFLYQCLVFAMIAGSLLVLNVAQAWLREMIKLKSREWLTRDLFKQWLEPGRAVRLSFAGEIGVNPDQRIQQDTSQLTELAAELGIGLLQASALLFAFLGVLWELSGAISVPIGSARVTIPGYMVWCALLFAAGGSWVAWRIGGPLVALNASRFQRESGLRFALVQVNQQADDIAQHHREQSERHRLGAQLDSVLAVMREIVGAVARVTWVTAGYGWITIIAPFIIAAPSYFGGSMSFGELMMVVGGFLQVNQSLRWFVDNFSRIAEWAATLSRVMSFREALLTFEARLGAEKRIAHSEDSGDALKLEDIGVSKGKERVTLDQRTIDVLPGDRIHIVDRNSSWPNPILAALAGLWPWGSGKVRRPPGTTMMFFKCHPYFPAGSLRTAIAFPAEPSSVSDGDIQAALERVGLGHLIESLDSTNEWGLVLTDDEQIRLGMARLLLQKPSWIFADGALDALADEHRDLITSIFKSELAGSAVISVGRRAAPESLAPKVIHLLNDSG